MRYAEYHLECTKANSQRPLLPPLGEVPRSGKGGDVGDFERLPFNRGHPLSQPLRAASSLREGAFGRERNIVLFAKGHLFEGAAASAAGGVFAFGMMHNKTALGIVDQHNKI